VVILHLKAKVQEEIQNNLADRYNMTRPKKRDVSVLKISTLIPDIIQSKPESPSKRSKETVDENEDLKSLLESNSKSVMQELVFDSEVKVPVERAPTACQSTTQKAPKMIPKKAPNHDPITPLKELVESGRTKDLKYKESGQNIFAFKFSVYFGPKPFQSTGESTKKKQAKRSAAAAMIE
jgi:hypothetical protein